MYRSVLKTVAASLLIIQRNIHLSSVSCPYRHHKPLTDLKAIIRAVMSAETNRNLRKRMIDEAEDDGDNVNQKTLRSNETETSSSDTSSTSSSSQTSNDEQTTSNAAESADVLIPFGPITDSLQFHSQADALKHAKLCNRSWTYTDSGSKLHCSSDDGCQPNSFKFTIASYNVLSQNLLEENSYLYSHCSNFHYLDWSYRQKRLLAEITYYQPDILCCQEIHEQHYADFFSPEMEKLGYQGSFKKRTRAMHDGCATFFKKSSFECEEVVPVEYFVPGVMSLDRDNVALLLLLKPKYHLPSVETKQVAKLCVANTHLLFNPRRGDVKLAQLMKLFAEIDRITFQPCPAGPHHRNHYPVLICGDMNMEPFCNLYKFVCDGKLALDGQPAAKLSGQERKFFQWRPMVAGFLGKHAGLTDQSQYVSICQQRFLMMPRGSCSAVVDDVNGDVTNDTTSSSDTEPVPCTNTVNKHEEKIFTQGSGVVSHKFGLNSVYDHFVTVANDSGHRGRREVTTHHRHANCTVDYIFYTPAVSDVNHSESDLLLSSISQATQIASHDESSDEHQCKLSAGGPLSADDNESFSGVLQQSAVSNSACEVSDYRLTLLARLQLLSDKEMKKIGHLPNKFISSDHLIIAAQFLLSSG